MNHYFSLLNDPKTELSILFKNLLAKPAPASLPIRYFCAQANWGDSINPIIISDLAKMDVHKSAFGFSKHILGIGSILEKATANSIIWGSGFISKKSILKAKPLCITAVRGRLSLDKLIAQGIEIDKSKVALGDPGYLAADIFKPSIIKNYNIGIIPHYVDYGLISHLKQQYLDNGVLLIDITEDIERVFSDIASCKIIISSSLHGLISAESLNIPNVWTSSKNKIVGGQFKFQDYYSLYNNFEKKQYQVEDFDIKSIVKLSNRANLAGSRLHTDDLLNSFQTALEYFS